MTESTILSKITLFSFLGIKVVGAVTTVFLILLYTFQEKLLYHPAPPGIPKRTDDNPKGYRNPGEWTKTGHISKNKLNSIPFEEQYLKNPDGTIVHTWLMLQEDSENRPTLVYFHGNAGNMGLRLKNAVLMYIKCNINVLMMDYRGFGNSEGTPTEKGLNMDAFTVMNYAKNHPR